MLDADQVIEINRIITGRSSLVSRPLLESALSSFHYYSSLEEQTCAVFRGLLSNHPFLDGNKRTAVTVLFLLAGKLGLQIRITDLELFDLVMTVIEAKLSIPEITWAVFEN